MLGQDIAELGTNPVFTRYGLERTEEGKLSFVPRGPYLRSALELSITLDEEGRCEAVRVVLPWRLGVHPLLGDAVRGLLEEVLNEASGRNRAAARFMEQNAGWVSDLTPLEVDLGSCQLSRTPAGEGRVAHRFTRTGKKGFLERLGLRR